MSRSCKRVKWVSWVCVSVCASVFTNCLGILPPGRFGEFPALYFEGYPVLVTYRTNKAAGAFYKITAW